MLQSCIWNGGRKMRSIIVQQFAYRSNTFFSLASLNNLAKCSNRHTTNSVMSNQGVQTRRNQAYISFQKMNTSRTVFSDMTRKNTCFSDTIYSNHKCHQSHSSKLLCSSTHNDLISRCCLSSQLRTRTVLQKTVHPQLALDALKYFQINRHFHTSPRANILIPPQIWLLLKPAQKLFAIIIGRSVRKWWQALPSNKRHLFKESMKSNKWKLIASLSGLGIVFILFYFTHLEETPITGRSRLIVFRKGHYDFLTKLEYEGLMEEYGNKILPEIDPRHLVVQQIVDHLIKCNSDMPAISEINWVVHVVENSEINAFVLPNGQMFVFTGLLKAVEETDQLSFILGHEIAHVLLEHTAEMASITHFLDFLFLISLMMIWAVCPMDSLAVLGQWTQSKLKQFMFDRPYGRTLETEADDVGLQLAAKACIDVRTTSVFWHQMELLARMKGQVKMPEWVSTHPSHEKRAEHLNRLIPEAIKLRESCNCPALSGPDPRLIFELTVKHLIHKSKEELKMIAEYGRLPDVNQPIQVEEKHPVLTAVKPVKN